MLLPDFSLTLLREHFNQNERLLHWMYRLKECLPVTRIVAITEAAGSPEYGRSTIGPQL